MKKKGGKYWSSSKYGKDWYILELKYIYYQIVAGKNIRIHVKLTDKKTIVGDYIITIFQRLYSHRKGQGYELKGFKVISEKAYH